MIKVTGNSGGKFEIRGDGFTASGTVLLNGKQLETLEWGDEYIRGKLPADLPAGDHQVTVWIDQTKKFTGTLTIA